MICHPHQILYNELPTHGKPKTNPQTRGGEEERSPGDLLLVWSGVSLVLRVFLRTCSWGLFHSFVISWLCCTFSPFPPCLHLRLRMSVFPFMLVWCSVHAESSNKAWVLVQGFVLCSVLFVPSSHRVHVAFPLLLECSSHSRCCFVAIYKKKKYLNMFDPIFAGFWKQ